MISRIVTLTLHPAIDRVVKIETMNPGGTFDGMALLTIPAGKGVNTARVVAQLSQKKLPIAAAVWVGENEANYFVKRLRELSGIECAAHPRAAATRFAQTYLEPDGRETHIKEAMAAPCATEFRAFLDFWSRTVRPGDLVAICGSAPKGTRPGFLNSIFSIAKQNGVQAIVADTNGPALRTLAVARITMLKGNAAEIGELFHFDGPIVWKNSAHRRQLLNFLLGDGITPKVMVTLGSQGALLVSPEKIIHCRVKPEAFDSKIIATTGCGDAATAGAIHALIGSGDDEEILKSAVACGAAKTLSADPGRISLKHYRRFVRYCEVNRIDALKF